MFFLEFFYFFPEQRFLTDNSVVTFNVDYEQQKSSYFCSRDDRYLKHTDMWLQRLNKDLDPILRNSYFTLSYFVQ